MVVVLEEASKHRYAFPRAGDGVFGRTPPVVLYKGTKDQIDRYVLPAIDQAWETYPFDPLHQRVREEMQRHGFAVVDLKPVLSRFPNKDLMLWGTDGHTSAYANRIIAQDLVAHLPD